MKLLRSILSIFFCIYALSSVASDSSIKKIINFNQLSTTQGLSHNYAYRTVQDSSGFIWIATQDGVNRYDGHEFTVYRNNPADPSSIIGNDVRVIFKDSQDNLWFAARGKGLSRYIPSTDSFQHYLFQQPNKLSPIHIMTEIIEGPEGFLWIGTGAGLVKFDPRSESHQIFSLDQRLNSLGSRVRDIQWLDNGKMLLATGIGLRIFDSNTNQHRLLSNGRSGFEQINFGNLIIDQNDNIWASSLQQPGIYRISRKQLSENKTVYPFKLIKGADELGRIYCLYLDKDGVVWIGTRSKGLYYFDAENQKFHGYAHQPGVPSSLPKNAIIDIFQDRSGLFWAGTWSGGIATFNLNNQSFKNFVSVPYQTNSLAGKNIWDLMRTKDGNYWFGSTDRGLTRYNPVNNSYQHFSHDKNDPDSLSGHRVWSLGEREDGLLWVGLYFGGLNLFDPESGKVLERYYQNPDGPAKYPHSVINMKRTKDGTWWFATRLQGLARWQESTKSFKFYPPEEQNPYSLQTIKIFAMYEDSKGQFWIGGERGGLNLYRPESDDFISYRFEANNPHSLASNEVLSLGEDSKGRLLVGTEQGLNIMTSDGVFELINRKDGLTNETINGILTDCHGDIWVSTNQSLSRIDPNQQVVNFNQQSGIVSSEFNTTAYRYGMGCELLFGGAEGAISFTPSRLSSNAKPQISLSKILKYYQPYHPNKDLSQVTQLEFNHLDQVISFAISLTDYNHPQSHRFEYRLNKNQAGHRWIEIGQQNIITLTNLPSGRHQLEFRGTNGESNWSDAKSIELFITPPWWLSWSAFSLYAITIIAILFLYLRLQQQKLNAQKQLTIKEREVAVQLRQLDKLKDQFLANTSHELRTPLNAIIGLSEIAALDIEQNKNDTELDAKLNLIKDSGKRLLTLVSDILDFSALAEKKLRVNLEPIEVAPIIKNLVLELQILNQTSSFDITYNIQPELPKALADEHRLYQILLNLLSNAIKFTKEGEICVIANADSRQINIEVTDSGIGIPRDRLGSIFNRFEQVDNSDTRKYSGTGLGLSITKELVELHNGSIRVYSTQGKGTTFSISLPIAANID
jgi:two-component system, sensor histidine kinase ChiS